MSEHHAVTTRNDGQEMVLTVTDTDIYGASNAIQLNEDTSYEFGPSWKLVQLNGVRATDCNQFFELKPGEIDRVRNLPLTGCQWYTVAAEGIRLDNQLDSGTIEGNDFGDATNQAHLSFRTSDDSVIQNLKISGNRFQQSSGSEPFVRLSELADSSAVLRSRNKADVLARLGQADVPVPETVVVSNPAGEAELIDAFERLDPPVVVKPNSTTRGTGVAKAHDLDSFLGIVDYLDLVHDYRATGDRSFLVQEYLADATDYRAMVVDGEYVGAVERRLPESARERGQWKHNVHRGAEAEGVDLPADLRELAEQAAAVLDIPYLGVDLLVTDDRAVVNETNARPTIDSATKYEDGFWDDLAGLIRATAESNNGEASGSA
jgi:ribosomal protein S6--L-glutamate ligase